MIKKKIWMSYETKIQQETIDYEEYNEDKKQ